ncbi:MAG: hypothetical protein ACI89U_001456 [Gammaproteobacteria bacterium]
MERIEARRETGKSPSEADEQVHVWQLGEFETPEPPEPAITIDTCNMTLSKLLALL